MQRRSASTLIAWMSLCILAAAWGPVLESSWRTMWSIMGAFGLAAALGLQAAEQVRSSYKKRAQRKETEQRYEHQMTTFEANKQAKQAVAEMVERVIEDAERNGAVYRDSESLLPERRGDSRTFCRIAVEVSLLDDLGKTMSGPDGNSFAAYIRNISTNGISLLHRTPLESPRVALRVELSNGSHITLMAILTWHRTEENGWYSSGGKLTNAVTEDISCLPESCASSG